jgi:hypothetical protein
MSIAEGVGKGVSFMTWPWYVAEAIFILVLLLFVLLVSTGEVYPIRWWYLVPLLLLTYGVDQFMSELYLKYGKEVKP